MCVCVCGVACIHKCALKEEIECRPHTDILLFGCDFQVGNWAHLIPIVTVLS